MSSGRSSKARKNTAVEAMVIATADTVTTKEAGSVDISLPAGAGVPMGGILVNSRDAGSVNSTGAPNLPSSGLAAVDANSAATDGWMVTTVAAGSVNFAGQVKNLDTTGAGSVKIGYIAVAGDNGQEGGKVSWKVAAAMLLVGIAVYQFRS